MSTVVNLAIAATVLFALTVAIGIGIVGATIGIWLPIIRTGQLFLLF